MTKQDIPLQKLRNRYERISGSCMSTTWEYRLESLAEIELQDYYLFAGILDVYKLSSAGLKKEFWLEYFKKNDKQKSGSLGLERIAPDKLPFGANGSGCEEFLQAQIHKVGRNEAIINFYSRNIQNFIRMYFVSLDPIRDELKVEEVKGGERK